MLFITVLNGITNYPAFLSAAIVFALVPGVDSIFVLNKSIGFGSRAGISATMGITVGNCLHMLVAGFGLAVILDIFPAAFTAIKYAGAAYMAYLGISVLIDSQKTGTGEAKKGVNDLNSRNIKSGRSHFVSGFLVNLLNPKIPIFLLSFIPQFIEPSSAGKTGPFIMLGITFISLGTIWFCIISLFGGLFSRRILASPKTDRAIKIVSGIVFLLLAVAVII